MIFGRLGCECAQQLGWSKDNICVIDEDQGHSGSTPHTRLGFKDLVTAVGRSEVGIVLGLEISRLARNSPDWANLMYLCRFTDTLVGDETGVYDPTNPTDRMVLGLRGQVSEMELDTSIHRMVEARWSKARRGELLTMSPTGYEVDETGQLVMTSDETVVTAIRAVFGKFDELGSARQVYLFFAEQNLLLPARQKELRSHPVVWVKPSAHRVLYILRHPVYAGAFVFGRTEVVRQLDGGDQPKVITRRARRTQWPVLIHDHHPAYISFDKFLQNQKRLDLNRLQDNQNSSGPARAGRALLHGLVRCGKCGRQMWALVSLTSLVSLASKRPFKKLKGENTESVHIAPPGVPCVFGSLKLCWPGNCGRRSIERGSQLPCRRSRRRATACP
jgi:DNA invertase Pin-like site-specific DNA recombinase